MESQNELTPDEVISGKKSKPKSIDELLYPPLSGSFKYEDAAFDSRSSIEKAVDAYNGLPLKPYIKHRDFNTSQYDYDPKQKTWEIGVKLTF